jgi:dihydroflavonol-4-reductase
MKIAVTGANGHVGVNLCRTLIEHGHEVTALVHTRDAFIRDIPVKRIKGDILNKDSLREFLSGQEICYHLAACISIRGDTGGMVRRINVDGTLNMVETARDSGVTRFIHFSSIHAFNQHPTNQPLHEERDLVTDTGFAYDRSKAQGERIVKAAVNDGFDAFILSPTAIIGPADPEPSLTGKALLELYNKQIPVLVPGGYDWVDVRDVADAAVRSISLGRKGEKYLLSGTWASLVDLSGMISRVTGKQTVRTVIPLWVARAGLPFITLYSWLTGGDPLYTTESLHIISEGNKQILNNKARRELNFHTRELETTVRDIFEWFTQHGYIKPYKS